jgi:hypothetical protein
METYGGKIRPRRLSQPREIYGTKKNHSPTPMTTQTDYQTSACKWTRPRYIELGLDELSSGVTHEVISQTSRQPYEVLVGHVRRKPCTYPELIYKMVWC